MAIQIVQAQTDDHISQLRVLLQEYVDFNRRLFTEKSDLANVSTFRSVSAEMNDLPGIFAPPRGRFLVALDDAHGVGCAALKPVSETVGEIKRMYIKPAYRGQKIGWRMGSELVDAALQIGYMRLRLDSHRSLTDAHKLYLGLGFVQVSTPNDMPEWARENMIFMVRDLSGTPGSQLSY